MKNYTIVQAATFGPGTVLGLTDEQAAIRAHAVKKIGKGVYEVVSSTQFKVGEIIGYDGDLPKALGAAVIDEKAAAARARTEKQRREKETAEQREQVRGEVYAEMMALLPQELAAQVEKALTDAANAAAKANGNK